MKSIIQTEKECYLCRRFYNLRTVKNLEEHHIVFGRGRRRHNLLLIISTAPAALSRFLEKTFSFCYTKN